MNIEAPASHLSRTLLGLPGRPGVEARGLYFRAKTAALLSRTVLQRSWARATGSAALEEGRVGAALIKPRRDVLIMHGNPNIGNNRTEPLTARLLAQELRSQGATPRLALAEDVTFDGSTFRVAGVKQPIPEAIIVRRLPRTADGNAHLLRLQQAGVHITNPPEALRYGNKSESDGLFVRHAIPHVDSVIARSDAQLEAASRVLPFPVVVKDPTAAASMGVDLARNPAELTALGAGILKRDAGSVQLQPFHQEAEGRSARVLVMRKRDGSLRAVSGTAWYAPRSDFRSNGASGGMRTSLRLDGPDADLPRSAVADAVRATRVAGLDVCAVDLIWTNRGWKVLELNPSPGLTEYVARFRRDEQLIPNLVDYAMHGVRQAGAGAAKAG